MDIATRRVHAMEVLLRWRRPGSRAWSLPDQFIPILEENGLIVPVGEWVIRRACEQSVAWQRQGLRAGAAGGQPVAAPVHAPRAGRIDPRASSTKPASTRR